MNEAVLTKAGTKAMTTCNFLFYSFHFLIRWYDDGLGTMGTLKA
jgi:hypothetical protein